MFVRLVEPGFRDVEWEILRGYVGVADRNRHRQMTARRDLSREHRGDGISALLPRLPADHHRVGHILPGGHFDDAADIEHHHHFLAGGTECPADAFDERRFVGAEQVVSFDMPVECFGRGAADRDHGHVRFRGAAFGCAVDFRTSFGLRSYRYQGRTALIGASRSFSRRIHST